MSVDNHFASGQIVLSEISTKELVGELCYRDGVEHIIVEPYKNRSFDIDGAAIVLIVTD